MGKEEKKVSGKRKRIVIIAIILVILLVAFLAGYFILNNTTKFSFGFAGFDFSSSANAIDSIGDAANTNTFENAKLNPFANETG